MLLIGKLLYLKLHKTEDELDHTKKYGGGDNKEQTLIL